MKFFDKEKDIIHRIINLVFIIWIIVTLVIFYNGAVNLFLKEPLQSYNEYKEENCTSKLDINDVDMENYCNIQYNSYKSGREETNTNNIKQIISSLASGLTVAGTLYLLNRKQKKVK